MSAAVEPECIDCRAESDGTPQRSRKIVTGEGEPKRCTTHLRRFTTRQRQQARGRHVERTYEISATDAGALLKFQGGRCAICDKATGASKLLAIEHDHSDDWVRGRCCSTCNQFLTRQLGDDPAKAQNLVRYLSGDTPYRRMLAERWIRSGYPQIEIRELCLYVEPTRVRVSFVSGGVWENWYTTLENLQALATPKRLEG